MKKIKCSDDGSGELCYCMWGSWGMPDGDEMR